MEVKILEDSLLIRNILVIGDIHLGYEEGIIEKGFLPKIQLREILEKLDRVFKIINQNKDSVKKIVLLGDLKHEFGKILDSEWEEVLKLIDYLLKKCKNIILIRGNHDNFLSSIIKKRNIKLKFYYKLKINGKTVFFLHGDNLFEQCLNSDFLIMGHLHPAITFKDKYKQEKFKCFLNGVWENKNVYILPSFSGLNQGYDLRGLKDKDFMFIKNKNLLNFDVLVYNNKNNKIYDFGKLKKLK